MVYLGLTFVFCLGFQFLRPPVTSRVPLLRLWVGVTGHISPLILHSFLLVWALRFSLVIVAQATLIVVQAAFFFTFTFILLYYVFCLPLSFCMV